MNGQAVSVRPLIHEVLNQYFCIHVNLCTVSDNNKIVILLYVFDASGNMYFVVYNKYFSVLVHIT